jgi:predicted nucleic acid-binding protein
MAGTTVYRWHLDPDLKRRLEDVARAEKITVARLLNGIAREWLAKREAEDKAEQRRLHAEAAKWIGSIDSGDRHGSERFRERVRMREMQLPLLTTAAVLAETLHFLRYEHQLAEAWRFYRSGTVMLLPGIEDDLPDLERLMMKYADRPMDFADATLVRLAEREGLATILTVDRDFDVYRIGGRKAFRVLPKR